MPGERTDLAEARVRAARAELTGRLETLERRVVGAVDSTTASVRETAGAIHATVSGAADEVRGVYRSTANNVREALNISSHVREHPWPSVTLAAVAGFMTAVLPRRRVEVISSPAAASGRNPFRELGEVLKRELIGLGESAILAASQAVKNNVQTFAAEFRPGGNHHHNGVCGSAG